MLSQVLATLRDNFKFGQRNYTIFQVGKATLLRVSDVISLKKADVFDEEGRYDATPSSSTRKLTSKTPFI